MNNVDISIVIPLYNERDSIEELVNWIHNTLEKKYIFIFRSISKY